MKKIDFDEAKNQVLREERNVSFEDVIEALKTGKLLQEYKGKGKYSHQKYYE